MQRSTAEQRCDSQISTTNSADRNGHVSHPSSQSAWSRISEVYPRGDRASDKGVQTLKNSLSGAATPKFSPSSSRSKPERTAELRDADIDLDFFSRTGLEEAVIPLIQQHKAIVRDSDLLQSLFQQQSQEIAHYNDKNRFVRESVDALVDTFTFQKGFELAKPSLTSFEAQKTQFQDDSAALAAQSEVVLDTTSKAGTRQSEIVELMHRFMATFETFISKFPGGDALLKDPRIAAEPAEPVLSERSDDIPAVAQKYFDVLASIASLNEEIYDFEIGQEERRQQRELLREQQPEVAYNDSAFPLNYEQRHFELIVQRDKRKLEVLGLKQECEALGLDLERLRYRRPLDEELQEVPPPDMAHGPSHLGLPTSPPPPELFWQIANHSITIRATPNGVPEDVEEPETNAISTEERLNYWLTDQGEEQRSPPDADDVAAIEDDAQEDMPSAASLAWTRMIWRSWQQETQGWQLAANQHQFRHAARAFDFDQHGQLRRARSTSALGQLLHDHRNHLR